MEVSGESTPPESTPSPYVERRKRGWEGSLSHLPTTYSSLPVLTLTTFTCDQYAHHVLMDAFFKNKSKNKDLREWNPRRRDEQDMVITS